MKDELGLAAEAGRGVAVGDLGLSWLLSPFKVEAFVSQNWASRPLRITRDMGTYYCRLLPAAELELVLSAASRGRSGCLELLSEGDVPQPCRSYEQAINGFRKGKSLRIDGIQKFSLAILALVRALERTISSPVNVNMYLTPDSRTKALERHYDTHDVFVLQIHGNKRWRLYEPHYPAPLEFLPLQRYESVREMQRNRLKADFDGRDSCIQTEEFTLEAGDCLYLPRGVWHEAESMQGDVSCHLTIGIQPLTYLDLITVSISDFALRHPELREGLPFGFSSDSSAVGLISARVAQILEKTAAEIDISNALNQISDHALNDHKIEFRNDLLVASHRSVVSELEDDIQYCVREDIVCKIDAKSSPPQLIAGSQAFEITDPYVAACQLIFDTRRFKISDLPFELALPQKVALVQQLIAEGALIRVDDVGGRSLTAPRGWVPIQVDMVARTVRWLDFGSTSFAEPFFWQTVQKVRKGNPDASVRSTSFAAVQSMREEMPPAGFIFHVSRCGSTLLSNCLKVLRGTVVVSEPEPFGEILISLQDTAAPNHSTGCSSDSEDLLRGIVRSFGQRRRSEDSSLVFKFSSWNILYLDAIRRLWPEVPCAILIRDPLEVAVSCIENWPGWMHWKRKKHLAFTRFPWDRKDTDSMSNSTYCARVIGEFLRCAADAIDSSCFIIDYAEMDTPAIVDVARRFYLDATTTDIDNINRTRQFHSKRDQRKQVFVEDRCSKQYRATESLRKEVELWARPAYDSILRKR